MKSSSVPGPRFAKLTNLILRYHQVTRTAEPYIHSLHSIYGPIVQIAYNQISITSPAAVRDVFAVHRHLDRAFPLTFLNNYGAENLVSTLDGGLHRERRKCVRNQYHRRVVDGERVGRVLEKRVGDEGLSGYIDTHSEAESGSDRSVNVHWMFRYLGADIMSSLVYGERFGLSLLQDQDARRAFQIDLNWDERRMNTFGAAITLFMPRFATWLISRGWTMGQTPETMLTSRLGKKAMAFYASKGAEGDEKAEISASETLCEQIVMKFEREGPSEALPSREYVLSECLDHFWAGVTTTADTLTAAVFYLSHPQNKARQERLRRELHEAGISLDSTDALGKSKNVKYLEYVIRETLRRNPAVAETLTRRVGPEDNISIDGHTIPPGTEVGFQPYSLHRDPNVFPDGESWIPERWEDAERYSIMKRHLVPFGAGPRMCIGLNVAWNELYAVVASIYSRYETNLTDELVDRHPEALLGGPEMNKEKKQLRMVFRKIER